MKKITTSLLGVACSFLGGGLFASNRRANQWCRFIERAGRKTNRRRRL